MKSLIAACVLLFGTISAPISALAQEESFVFRADSLTPYTRTYLGNGVFSLVSSQLATKPAESYMIKVYDRAADDVPRIAALPAWNEVNVFNGERWLNDTALDNGSIRSWVQTLNTYDGDLQTSYTWADGKKEMRIAAHAFVSRENPHLAAIRLHVTPQYSGPVRILLPIRAWKPPARYAVARLTKLERGPDGKPPNVRYPGYMVVQDRGAEIGSDSGVIRVTSRAEGGNTAVAETVAVTWPKGLKQLNVSAVVNDEIAGIELSFDAVDGTPYVFQKFVGVASSFDDPTPLRIADDAALSARTRGYEAEFRRHADAWHSIWKTDIIVEGNPELQKVIHSTIFYLLGSVRQGTEFNVPPMGLSSSGYVGHIFWDSDTFMFPPLLLLHPEAAKSFVMFRYRTLEAARTNARLNGWKGAMYPWEADETGAESTPHYAWEGATGENHVTSDVALAMWQYYCATGDKEYLEKYAYPVIRETADYWVSRSAYNKEKDRYEIHNVVSPDEGSRGVNNDVVTNVGAWRTLDFAIIVSKMLGKPVTPEWAKVKDKMYIVYNAEGQYYPEFEGAPAWKQNIGHVTPLMNFPFEYPAAPRAKRNTLENALKSITSTGGGAFLLPTIYPMVAAETGDQALVDDCLSRSYKPYMKPPFNVINEGPRGESVNFLTGTGLLQQFVYGYTGLRLTPDKGVSEKFKPMLPAQIKKLTVRNATIRGKKYDLVVEGNSLRIQ